MAGDWRARTWEQQAMRDAWDSESYKDDPRAQLVVERHPGGLDQKRIGLLMGCSKQRVEQIERRARAKVRRRWPDLARLLEQMDETIPLRKRGGAWVQKDHMGLEHRESPEDVMAVQAAARRAAEKGAA